MQRTIKGLCYTGGVLFCLWLALSIAVAYALSRPHSRDFKDITELDSHPVEAVTFDTADAHTISGWYVPLKSERAVIFTHGIGADRRQLDENMKVFLNRGYAALAIDLRSHGKSQADRVSMGWYERNDLEGAIQFLKSKGYQHIGADGISLGAATIVYAFKDKPALDFVVLESPYDTIDNALDNRVKMYGGPVWIAYGVRTFAPFFVGAGAKELRPLDWMRKVDAPTLLLAGTNEDEIPVGETRSLYEACAAKTKEMHLFEGAKHTTRLVTKYKDEYAQALDEFLAKVYPAGTTIAAAK